jgi:predicted Zn-ribbon and HTH transcriptional regulator
MKRRIKEPPVPVEMKQTVRQQIISLLNGYILSAKDISTQVMVSEKEVYEHLEHIQKTINRSKEALIITPAACKKCGFSFRKRERLSKPGKCPVCRSKLIDEPLFSISKGG